MHPIAQQLMNAQLQFVLKELSGDALSGHLQNEANAYCDLLERISVRQLFSEEVIAGWIERNILGYEPTEALRQQAVHKLLANPFCLAECARQSQAALPLKARQNIATSGPQAGPAL